MKQFIHGKTVDVVEPQSLYKWASIWGKVQKNYYPEPVMIRREKQIADFINLNEYSRPFIIKDTDVFLDINSVDDIDQADLIVITDQKYSRLPCDALVGRIRQMMDHCADMILCINRHYFNIDHSFVDTGLSDHFPLAITQWLKKQLPDFRILDLSLDYLDKGDYFTWVIPDRIYFIQK